ncbi:MAG: prephenate dehydrogenase/arogenate dehydrogenase family protein [Lentisphaeria bacterium]|nr:prephenate dehydrogenase/arogenate dehydrogenase family protein [Lentisphaeria bacterium]
MAKEKLVIAGLGMLGVSLASSLKLGRRKEEKEYEVFGYARRREVAEKALADGFLDGICETPEEAFRTGSIIILALPVPVICQFIEKYASFMGEDAVLTDIGSVKGLMEESAKKVRANFVGSHPMAGTELSGPEAFVPGIYENASVFIVPPEQAQERDIARVEKLWKAVGGTVLRIDAKAHDSLVAHTSHVPHIISSALALSVLDEEDASLKEYRFAGAASGFRDTIRVAASSPRMWREILSSNRAAVLEALEDYEKRYEKMKEMIRNNDFDAFEKEFARGGDLIREWRKAKKC